MTDAHTEAHTEALAEAHDALRLLTPDSTMMELAETVGLACALEYATQHGCTADYLAERAAKDCLFGTSLSPRIQGYVRMACLGEMRRLFARGAAGGVVSRLPAPPRVPAEAREVAMTVPPPARYDDEDANPALHVLLDGRCAHCDALVVGAIACPPCAEWAASMDEWSAM